MYERQEVKSLSASSNKNNGVNMISPQNMNSLKKYNKMMKQLQATTIQLEQFKGLAQMSEEMWKAGDINAKVMSQFIGLRQSASQAVSTVANQVSGAASSVYSGITGAFSGIGKSVREGISTGAKTIGKPFSALWGKMKAMKAAADQKEAAKEAAAQQAHYLYGTPLPKPKGIKRLQKIVGNSPIQDSEKQMKMFSSVMGTASGLLGTLKDKSFEAAKVFSTAMGTLRASSMAAPEQMQSLAASLRTVGGQVPQNLNEVAKVLGTLSKRTHLTGTSLEQMSRTVLDASRLSGAGSAEVAESAGKVMDAWGKKAGEGASMLDQFFAASRSGNVGMGDLMKSMGQFGEPMREMGLGFEQSAALLAKWQSKGLTPIQDALKKEMPAGGIATVAAQIKNAATAADAAGIATKYFGEKVGADLVTALKGGQVEFQGIIAAMNSSQDAIKNQSNDVLTFGEKWDMLQNRITIALAPLGEALLPFGLAMASAIEVLTKDADIVLATIGSIAALLIGVFAPALWASAVAGWAAVAPFLPIIAAVLLVGAAVAGLAYLFKYHMDEIMKYVNIASNAITSLFGLLDDDKKATIEVQRKATEQATSNGGPPSQYYHGLDYVPYDGMMARLHKGERVMTASENREFSNGSGSGGTISITGNTFNVRQESDIDAIARALAREIKAAGGLMA